MSQPLLVVDLGASATGVAVLADGQADFVPEPASGDLRWPSALCLDTAGFVVGEAARRLRTVLPDRYAEGVRVAVDHGAPVWFAGRHHAGEDLVGAYLAVVRAVAERYRACRIERLALAVPADYAVPDARRERLVAAAAAAGFPDAELVSDAVAAALDPGVATAVPDDGFVLVCDLGVSWTVTLTRLRGGGAVQLGHETSAAGRELDALTPAELVDPALRWLVASARAVLARSEVAPGDVAAVLLVGAGSRLGAAPAAVEAGLGRPVWQPVEPELAVTRGATRWAAAVAGRRLPASQPAWQVEPLAWDVPGGRASLIRWLVAEGQAYPAGAPLAQIRTTEDEVYDLVASRDGVLARLLASPGETLTPASVAATAQVPLTGAGARPTHRHRLRVAGSWLLTTDHRQLVECGRDGAYVKVRTILSGAVLTELRPLHRHTGPHSGQVFVSPAGRLALVAWDTAGHFEVWDVDSGRLTASFEDPARPLRVRVNEPLWRLLAEMDRKVQVGRYRRDVATVWDLDTGARIEERVGQDLHKQYQGYADRTAEDGFGPEAHSPDGRLRAAVVRGTDGAAVVLYEVETGQELLRSAVAADDARTAFSADGAHLLTGWRADDASWVDVWRI